MEKRYFPLDRMERREEGDGRLLLAGYFARFNQPYKICEGWIEMIAPGAFARFLATGEDVKALWNHNHDLVLGSRANGTLVLREDDVGLFGEIEINRADSAAMDAHARIARGDVSGCSFGFDCAVDEYTDENGVYHTVIREVYPLFEVSPCTFPAYPSTSIEARSRLDERRAALRQKTEIWREQMRRKLKGETEHGN